ncbi:hypothetical protein Q1695_012723 [Nippostrongylus brasiliensis]|nr:hypothetical protein Q1695_012723 [Nippostrongylus brasiliensis]
MSAPTLSKGKKEVKFKQPITVGVEVKDSKVINISPSSELMGVLYVGDQITSVNGTPVTNSDDFLKAANAKLPGTLTIDYMRDEMCTYEMKNLPQRKPGYDLFELTLTWRSGGTPIGILIHRDFSGRVVIAMVESGCTASKVVKPGDAVVKVNGTDVNDRDVARKLIMTSINKDKKVTLTIERCTFAFIAPPLPKPGRTGASTVPMEAPPSPPLKSASQASSATAIKSTTMAATVNTKLDVPLPADVLAILEANKNFFLQKCTLPPCLKKTKEPPSPSSPNKGRMDVMPSPTEQVIPYDASPKPLKITPKRLGS